MPSVLIVEDDTDIREFMQLFLESAGYATVSASNGREALSRMHERRPCAVLLDIQMPVMDGFEFRQRQLADPALAGVPVLCVSAVFDTEEVARRTRARCLSKPLDFDRLLSEVGALCHGD